MKRIALVSLSLFALGGCAAGPHSAAAPAALRAARATASSTQAANDLEDNPYVAKAPTDARRVGDFVTTRFEAGGKHAVTTQQRVLARDGSTSVIEVAIQDGARTRTFRLRTATSAGGEQVLGVTRVEKGVEHASTLEAYEAAMQKTIPDVERNDGVLDTEPVTVDVGGHPVDAMRTTYKVSYAGKEATMSVIHADGFAWGDLGGDVIAADGKILYRTRIVEAGSDTKKAVADR